MRSLLGLWIGTVVLLPTPTVAQTNDGNTYRWCAPQVNRLYAMFKEGHPLANEVSSQIVGNKKLQFENVKWPIPPFPEAPAPQTLLQYRVQGGSYYWWFDGSWTRVAAEADVLERSGLIYGIGSVEKVTDGVALIDLGDVHTLKTVAPFNKVVVFRLSASRYSPIGMLTIAETFATFSRTNRSATVNPQPGDVVMFVRELSQMKSVEQHRDEFLRREVLRTSTASVYSNVRRYETANALRVYHLNHQRWERSKGTVIGFLNGDSFSEGRHRQLKGLLSYIDLIREHHRDGLNSLPAAGPQWTQAMEQLIGTTVHSQHAASQTVVENDNIAFGDEMPTAQEIRRVVRLRFFANTTEQNNLLSYLIATQLEVAPASPDVWIRQQLLNSQFPEMAEDEGVLELTRRVVQELTGG